MKKYFSCFLALLLIFSLVSCGEAEPESEEKPEESQMKAICELAVMDCYYHNVAKFEQEDAERFLFWLKDKKFWIEYGGIVTLGVDVSKVTMDIKNDKVIITIPPAEVLNCKVDSSSLSEESFVVAADSAKITADDEIKAFDMAQQQLKEAAASDVVLLANAQQRAQSLLEEYVANVGKNVGTEYTIQWIYLDENGEKTEGPSTSVAAESAPEESTVSQ
jgi:hypothetical protein